MVDPAVLELLQAEVEEGMLPLAEAFMVLATEAPGSDAFTAAIEQGCLQVDCIRVGAEAGGLPGLEIVCDRFMDNLAALKDAGPEQLAQLDELLSLWPERLMAYLQDPASAQAVGALAGLLQGEHWPRPLGGNEVELLTELLTEAPGEAGWNSGEPARSRDATAEDVSLVPSDDVNMEVFAAFVDDAPQHAAAFSAHLQSLATTDDIAGTLDQARRIAHTLKGAAGVAGVAGVMNLTHHLEDLLEYLGKSGGRPGAALTATLSEAADCLETMIDALTGADVPPDNSLGVLQSVLDWANRMDRGELQDPQADTAAPASSPAAEGHEPEAAVATPAADTDAPAQSLRVPLQTFDSLFRFAGELSVAAAQLDERINRVLRMQQAFAEQDKVIQQRLFELEDLIDIRDVASAGYHMQAAREPALPSGGDDGFDPLEMDEYNELHGVSRMLGEAIADWRELNMGMHDELLSLRNAANQQGRLHRALENTVLSTRLVPVRTVLSRLQRSVRQACRATGKEAELVITGEDLTLDTELLQSLMDPLGHLLRNAVDHGIEPPELRAAADKPAAGTIRLDFRRDGSMIEVRCEDDGRGMDLGAVHRRAVERGIIAAHDRPTPDALARIVLLPGFSTREEVTRMSGRGVGLDVVHDRVRSLQGTVDVATETGAGSTFVLRVPAALVTVHVLLLESGGQTVAIPSSDLLQVPVPGSGRIERGGDKAVFHMGETEYQLRTLAAVMGRPVAATEAATPPMVLARVDGEPLALAVDRLVGGAEVVIKRFGDNLPRVRGVLGAAILGDGTVAPVLDLAGLLREPVAQAGADTVTTPQASLVAGMAEVLVVDDSLSVRRSLAQFLQDSGFRVRLARDGIEAVRAVEERHPDLLLVDMEMPRMNGLELAAHLRQHEATRALPIIMLTSRSMQKHRRQAELAGVSAYLTKPFQEPDLLECIEQHLSATDARTA
ncbi:MAG: response regulator [Aquisalimonadaceae bacterium]